MDTLVRKTKRICLWGIGIGAMAGCTNSAPAEESLAGNVAEAVSAPTSGWTPAGELQAGHVVRTAHGVTKIASIERKAGATSVFNLNVAAPHTFFAGESQALVHNNDCAPELIEFINPHNPRNNAKGYLSEDGTFSVIFEDAEIFDEMTTGPEMVNHLLGQVDLDKVSSVRIHLSKDNVHFGSYVKHHHQDEISPVNAAHMALEDFGLPGNLGFHAATIVEESTGGVTIQFFRNAPIPRVD